MVKRIIKFTAFAAAAGALGVYFGDTIKKCFTKLGESVSDAAKTICTKETFQPKIIFVYDSSPTEHETVNAENNECVCSFTEEEKIRTDCICRFRSLLEAYRSKAEVTIIDAYSSTGEALNKYADFSDRFGISRLPAVLIVTKLGNLVAKLESADDVLDVKAFLDLHLQ